MNQIYIHLMRILFYISFLIGVSHSHKGKYSVFNGIVFCLAILWFGGCTLRLETEGLVFGSGYLSFRLCVVFCSVLIVNLVLFLSLINFHLKNSHCIELIALSRKLDMINSQIRGRQGGKRVLSALGVIGFNLLSGVIFLYWEETSSKMINGMYDRLCTMTLTWPNTMLCLQFSYWAQIFTFNFELISERIRGTMVSAKQTNTKWLSNCNLPELINELKMVMQMKQAITDSYGSSIFLNQLYTFICFILNCTFWTHVEYMRGHRPLGAFRLYFVARILYYSVLSYIPHWIGQVAFSEVKAQLYEIRKLMIIHHSTAADDEVPSCLFHPAYDDLRFRVCDLFDLTNKQFVSVRPAVNLKLWPKFYGKREVTLLSEVKQLKSVSYLKLQKVLHCHEYPYVFDFSFNN